MFARLVRESFIRNPRRKVLTVAALVAGMTVTTASLMMALDVGDRLSREFQKFGANLLVTAQSDTLPLEIGGVDYRPVDEGAYLNEADLGKLKTIFWRHNIVGFTPFLDVPVEITTTGSQKPAMTTLIGTWYEHEVPVPDGTEFKTGASVTHPWWKIQGRWFADGANECVVGAALARRFPGGIAEGATIEVRPTENGSSGAETVVSLRVTGIVSTGDSQDQAILAPLSAAQRVSGDAGKLRELFVSALTKPEDAFSQRDPRSMTPTEYDRWFCSPYPSSIAHQIEQALPGTNARPIRRVAETEGRILNRVSSLLWLVTLAALAAAGLAVAATAATTVLERRSEVGLMKALGATNTLVAGVFLAEQVSLAVLGAGAGFLIGAGLARVLGRQVFGVSSSLQPVLFPVVLAIAIVVAVGGSLIPLRRASRFNPALVLRGE
jgi:putative ABC transport system permease protein